jgi:hypothetical protein
MSPSGGTKHSMAHSAPKILVNSCLEGGAIRGEIALALLWSVKCNVSMATCTCTCTCTYTFTNETNESMHDLLFLL